MERCCESLLDASNRRHTGCILTFLDQGVDVNLEDEHNQTALHHASWHNFVDVMEILLKCGVDVNRQNNIGSTALHCASWLGHKEAIMMLLDYGADFNIKNNKGATAFNIGSPGTRAFIINYLEPDLKEPEFA